VSVPVATQVEPEEVEAFFEVDDARLVLVEDQTPGCQPARKLFLDLFGLLPGIAAGDQVIGLCRAPDYAELGRSALASGVAGPVWAA
jgi:hypothetical protein